MSAAETASDAGFRGFDTDTLNSTPNTPHVTPLHPSLEETRVTSLRDGHSSDVPSEELADAGSEAHASACTTRRLCVLSRGVHLIPCHCISLSLMSRGLLLIYSNLIASNLI
jgi:hypothetical protein